MGAAKTTARVKEEEEEEQKRNRGENSEWDVWRITQVCIEL